MTETALITGATAGLGAEFARQLAAGGANLVLVARNADRLQESADRLRTAHGITVETISADLQTDGGVNDVVTRLADSAVPVTMLVNNAGYGLAKSFEQNPIEAELDHLNIHVAVPLTLTHAALDGMLRRRSGRIINVASVAGYTPRGTYGAVKAAVISFSRWANLAYRSSGVTVTALCPGFTHTEFHQRMQVDKKTVPGWMWLKAENVVSAGLRDAAAGKAVSVPSLRYKALVALTKVLPSSLVAAGAKRGR